MRSKIYKDKYEVFEDGKVINTETGDVINIVFYTEDRYPTLAIYVNGKKTKVLIHTLLAELFIFNDDPENKTEVDHIDGNKENFSLDNLEWVSHKENMRRAKENGQWDNQNTVNTKYSYEFAAKLRDEYVNGLTIKEISNKYGMNYGTASSIIGNRTWIDPDYVFAPKYNKSDGVKVEVLQPRKKARLLKVTRVVEEEHPPKFGYQMWWHEIFFEQGQSLVFNSKEEAGEYLNCPPTSLTNRIGKDPVKGYSGYMFGLKVEWVWYADTV